MKRITTPTLTLLFAAISGISAAEHAEPLYTREGVDPSFASLLESGAIKPGERFSKGPVTGSRIDVNNELLEKQVGKCGPIPRDIGLHTEGSGGIGRKDFGQWTRWYQEDGNVQVFRLFKGEQNVRGGVGKDGSPGRVEAYSKALVVAPGTWREWEGTYTVVQPVGACIFQLMHEGSLWPFHIEMSAKGDISFLARRPVPGRPREIVMAENMAGKSLSVKVRANGEDYEVYQKGPLDAGPWKLVTKGSFTKAKNNQISFRWGMYAGSKKGEAIKNDALLFVTGVTIAAAPSVHAADRPATGRSADQEKPVAEETAAGASAMSSEYATRPAIDYASLARGFAELPPEARLRVWWFWHAGMATRQSITSDLEAMKANGIGGAILCDNGSDSSPQGPVFMSDEWKSLFSHAIREATRLGIEISLNIQSGCGDPGNPRIAPDNGLKKIVSAETTVSGPGRIERRLPTPPVNEIFWQDIAVQAVRNIPGKAGDDAIRNWSVKTYNKNDFNLKNYSDEFPGDDSEPAIVPEQVVDLTARFKEGVLRWDAPAGDWTVIRYAMTATGKRNNYASAGCRGGLCYDPIHRSGVTAQWNDVAKPLIDIARRNGDSLKFLHVDSWEMGLCNWTRGFQESFRQRRGYDLGPYLPVLAGHIVGSRELSNRFLEDFRLTVGDLAAEENYELLRELAHSEGVALHMESAGPHQPPVDGLRTLGINDIPMGEAWARSTTHRVAEPARMQVALGASAAHIYGRRFLAAEAPTSVGPIWERGPGDVKNVLDRILCTGVNRINWHTYDSSPDEFGLPGIAYFAGTHLNRNVTWWRESTAFIGYISRAQHMLTQGLHVADVLGYLGSRAPLFAVLHRLERNDIPAGYAWDMCNADAFLTRASVRNGRIVLPDGKSYALFALSDDRQMHLSVLRKIERMVGEGMVLVGNPPQRPFGLGGYPESDAEFAAMVRRLWGGATGAAPAVNRYGKGRVFAGQPVDQVLKALDIGPDLAWEPAKGVELEYIHHRSEDGEVDVYYVINKWARHGIDDLDYRYLPTLPDRFVNVKGSFRVGGERVVERWDPVRGTITQVRVVESRDGCHHLPVSLEPEGGAFYVFRKAGPAEPVVRIARDGVALNEGNTPLEVGACGVFVRDGALEVLEKGSYEVTFASGRTRRVDHPAAIAPVALPGPWKVDFLERPRLGQPFSATYDALRSWTDSPDRAEKYFSGTARYTRSFSLDGAATAADRRAYLDLGFVGDVATVRLNGREIGVLWKAPYAADVTGFVKPGENILEVEVTNLWINRLIGDLKLPPGERKSYTNVLDNKMAERLKKPDADKYLRVSGLLGPVTIRHSRIYRMD